MCHHQNDDKLKCAPDVAMGKSGLRGQKLIEADSTRAAVDCCEEEIRLTGPKAHRYLSMFAWCLEGEVFVLDGTVQIRTSGL